MGHLANEPEMKMTATGHTVTTFRVATSRDWGNKEGENRPTADFHKIVAWRKLGEACGEYLKKGKGDLQGYCFDVEPGRIVFEVDGITDAVATLALKKASAKLPLKAKVVKRA